MRRHTISTTAGEQYSPHCYMHVAAQSRGTSQAGCCSLWAHLELVDSGTAARRAQQHEISLQRHQTGRVEELQRLPAAPGWHAKVRLQGSVRSAAVWLVACTVAASLANSANRARDVLQSSQICRCKPACLALCGPGLRLAAIPSVLQDGRVLGECHVTCERGRTVRQQKVACEPHDKKDSGAWDGSGKLPVVLCTSSQWHQQ